MSGQNNKTQPKGCVRPNNQKVASDLGPSVSWCTIWKIGRLFHT